jgi:hypothetical protein
MTDTTLNTPVIKEAKCGNGFRFINCIERKLGLTANIKAVTFNISRYGEHEKTLQFKEPVSESTAIAAAEAFLSVPLDESYYGKVKKDTFHEYQWEDASKIFKLRGDVLTDAKYLDATEYEDGVLTLITGS